MPLMKISHCVHLINFYYFMNDSHNFTGLLTGVWSSNLNVLFTPVHQLLDVMSNVDEPYVMFNVLLSGVDSSV